MAGIVCQFGVLKTANILLFCGQDGGTLLQRYATGPFALRVSGLHPRQACQPLLSLGPRGVVPEGQEQAGGTCELGSESRLKGPTEEREDGLVCREDGGGT